MVIVGILFHFIIGCGKNDNISRHNTTSVTVINEKSGEAEVDVHIADEIDFVIFIPENIDQKITLQASSDEDYEFLCWVDMEKDKEMGKNPGLVIDDKKGMTLRAHFRKKPEKVCGDNILAVVGKGTTLGSFEPDDLKPIDTEQREGKGKKLREQAALALNELLNAAQKDGVNFEIKSAYRSYETQERLFHQYKAAYGVFSSEKFSARPGQSEHQLGTAVDFGGTRFDFSPVFENTPQGKWLVNHAFLYGFALSYPQDSEEQTGYVYEPWHYRYIGVEQAEKWRCSGLTLIEYLRSIDFNEKTGMGN